MCHRLHIEGSLTQWRFEKLDIKYYIVYAKPLNTWNFRGRESLQDILSMQKTIYIIIAKIHE